MVSLTGCEQRCSILVYKVLIKLHSFTHDTCDIIVMVTCTNFCFKSSACKCINSELKIVFTSSLPWHCEDGCEFDLCFGCTRSHKSAVHRHPLEKSNPRNTYPSMQGWGCDICGRSFRHEDQEKPYECKKCHYDLCQNCMKGNKIFNNYCMGFV